MKVSIPVSCEHSELPSPIALLNRSFDIVHDLDMYSAMKVQFQKFIGWTSLTQLPKR